ncbi:hypothetical protein MPSEU_000953800 [Mayamaea pseudoterrestris]|nr:hypothetical protein MPSEU_000953800 [Mayamaea pseudoterrestris]
MNPKLLHAAFLTFSSPPLCCRRSLLPLRFSTSLRSPNEEALDKAKNAMTQLATRPSSWKRFQDLVELALEPEMHVDNASAKSTIRSAVDVGTDHGLLAICLAATGLFSKGGVIGSDVSEQALQSGAIRTLKNLQTYWQKADKNPLPVSFCVGNGLQSLEPGQADLICIAGMGVNTILEILSVKTGGNLLLDRLKTQRILLQPTSSRPRHLLALYSGMEELGWHVRDERMQKVGPRWYLSSSWEPHCVADGEAGVALWPGSKLATVSDAVFQSYLQHHCQWLRHDLQKTAISAANDHCATVVVEGELANL